MAKVGIREWLAIAPVIASGKLARYGGSAGSPLDRFEADFSAAFDVKHTLVVSNGTGALIAALAACGIGPGDEVLVPAYTWIATAAAPLALGAVPVLVEIDQSLTMDPADILRKITPNTRAIIPVHMANVVCDMDAIMRIAKDHNILVIEDACQAAGLTYKGRKAGTIGDVGVYSFNQFKNINVGEGGALVTNDDHLFARARMYHDIGAVFRGHLDNANVPLIPGINLKASQIQGAMLNVQLSKLEPMLRRMRKRYRAMAEILTAQGGLNLIPQHENENSAGLHVVFNTEEEARDFASRNKRGVHRAFDSSRHVYTFWQPILEQRPLHPKFNPYAWAERQMDYSPTACPRSLDILKRTCRITLGENYPLIVMRHLAKRMVGNSRIYIQQLALNFSSS